MPDTKDALEWLRLHPSSQETISAFDSLLAVLQAEEDMELAERKEPARLDRIAELRFRLRQSAQDARVQLAMLRGTPEPTGPKSLHPPGTPHAGSKHG